MYTELLANVAMLPGESFVRAVVEVWHTEFGVTKVTFDVSMSLTAVILSFVFCGQLQGVREGTIIAALLVGFIARTMGRWLKPFETILFKTTPAADSVSAEANASSIPNTVQVIAIGREYGSGGHDLGQELAKRLGFAFYDKDIIKLTAGTTGYSTQYIAKIAHEEKLRAANYHYYTHRMWGHAGNYDLTLDTAIGIDHIEQIVRIMLSNE